MPRFYVKDNKGKWNIFSSIVDDLLFDNFIDFKDLKEYVCKNAYEEKAKEMFEKLEYEANPYWEKDHTIEYIKRENDDFYGTRLLSSIIFHKRLKKIKIVGTLEIEDIQAINKQIEELGWK